MEYLDFARDLKNIMEHEENGDSNCNTHARNGSPNLGKATGKTGNRKMNRDNPNYSVAKIKK